MLPGIYSTPLDDGCGHAFGFRLLPLTLGHARLLEAIGLFDSDSDLQNIVLGVLVCSRPHERAAELIKRQGVAFHWLAWRVKRNGLRAGLNASVEAFRAYITYSLQVVKRWKKDGEASQKIVVPWVYATAFRLASLPAYGNMETVWNTRVNEAMIMLACSSAWEGDKSLQSPDEMKQIADMRAGQKAGKIVQMSWGAANV